MKAISCPSIDTFRGQPLGWAAVGWLASVTLRTSPVWSA